MASVQKFLVSSDAPEATIDDISDLGQGFEPLQDHKYTKNVSKCTNPQMIDEKPGKKVAFKSDGTRLDGRISKIKVESL